SSCRSKGRTCSRGGSRPRGSRRSRERFATWGGPWMRLSCPRRVRLPSAAALALWAAGLLAPGAARAGCGDYVTAAGGVRADPHATPNTPPPSPATLLPHGSHDPAEPTPCSGPACSRGHHAPPPFPDAPPDRFEDSACLLLGLT